jgi:hypothetical protein
MSETTSMVGVLLYYGQRKVTIVAEYEGHGPDDPSGYYYKMEGDNITHWISALALSIRFTKEPTHG